jgi:hypothetical protein
MARRKQSALQGTSPPTTSKVVFSDTGCDPHKACGPTPFADDDGDDAERAYKKLTKLAVDERARTPARDRSAGVIGNDGIAGWVRLSLVLIEHH